jgi:hypothetical protein
MAIDASGESYRAPRLRRSATGDVPLVRRVLAVLPLIVFAAGCGGGGEQAKPATNVDTVGSTPRTPAGYTVRRVRDQGFAVAVPKRWRSIDAATALSGAAVKQFAQENPAAAGAVEALSRPNSPMKFVAIDPSAVAFATNVNVLVSPIPAGIPFDRWTKAQATQVQALHPTHVTQGPVQLPPGKAYRLAYRAKLMIRGGPRELAIHQYMVKRADRLYVITYTTEAAEEARWTKTFDRSAHTFELST